MEMTKYYFRCRDCGRTLTMSVPKGQKPVQFTMQCTSTVKCGWAGDFKPSESFDKKTVNVKSKLKIR